MDFVVLSAIVATVIAAIATLIGALATLSDMNAIFATVLAAFAFVNSLFLIGACSDLNTVSIQLAAEKQDVSEHIASIHALSNRARLSCPESDRTIEVKFVADDTNKLFAAGAPVTASNLAALCSLDK